MSIKIIGAGLPRTGTNTLKESLERLGYAKTYHMKELLVHPANLPAARMCITSAINLL